MALNSKKKLSIFLKKVFSRKTHHESKKITKKNLLLIDIKKREKIDRILNDLARRDALINAGKMQFLNFLEVKNYMGVKWAYLEPIIIGIAIDVIEKYTDQTDIFFRYNEDDFIIIFANATPHESQLKCHLMTTEIQRLLFEETKKNKELKDIKIDLAHIGIKARTLTRNNNPLKSLDDNFHENVQKFIDDNVKKHTIITPEKPDTETGTSKEEILSRNANFIKNLHYKYIPVKWQNNQFKSNYAIVIDDCPTPYDKHDEPITDYYNILLSLPKSYAALCDLNALDVAARNLTDYPEASFFISVHYNTLVDNTYFQEYLKKLQKFEPEQRNRLSICVYKIPQDIPLTVLKKSMMLVTGNCKALLAIVPYFKHNNYAKLLNSGFKGICFVLLAKDPIPEFFEKHIRKFITDTKMYNFKTLALIGERANNTLTRDSLAGIDYIDGSIIGDALSEPVIEQI